MFYPKFWLRDPMVQTIGASQIPIKLPRDTRRYIISLDDGDQLLTEWNFPVGPPKGIVLGLHGLTGCSQSRYNLRLSWLLPKNGFIFVRANLRGAGPGHGLAKLTYHAGLHEDLAEMVRYVTSRFDLPLSLLGYSLGGSICLNYVSEQDESTLEPVKQFIVVSPPFDLAASSEKLRTGHPFWDRYFAKRMIETVNRLHSRYPELGPVDIPEDASLYDFDQLYTAPRHGFADAATYYGEMSTFEKVAKIKKPGLVIASADDPIIDYSRIPDLPRQIELRMTDYGGHCGFWGESLRQNMFWCDYQIVQHLVNSH